MPHAEDIPLPERHNGTAQQPVWSQAVTLREPLPPPNPGPEVVFVLTPADITASIIPKKAFPTEAGAHTFYRELERELEQVWRAAGGGASA